MPERDFRSLELRLLEGGITPNHARRIADELAEHWHDLCEEARHRGLAVDAVSRYADERMGSEPEIAAVVLAHRDLKTWVYRYPGLALVALPIAWVSLLPAVPVMAGVNRAPLIARWGACLVLSGLFTTALMLTLYLAILTQSQP